MENITLTFTQCKQLANLAPYWRDNVAAMDDQPEWITCNGGLNISDIKAIQQGGCDSGAYMPAVTYYTACETMNEHGDDVLQYIEDCLGELPPIPESMSWSGLAVFFLSYAIELWVSDFELDRVDWD